LFQISKSGVMSGNPLVQASRAANVAAPQLRAHMIAFVHNCAPYDLQEGTINLAVFAQSTDTWALMAPGNCTFPQHWVTMINWWTPPVGSLSH
jgi:conjugal transfer mating pair stabilization protein TraG